MTHTVAEVRFLPRTPGEDAPMRCSCGWSGMVAEWWQHRRAVGADRDPKRRKVA